MFAGLAVKNQSWLFIILAEMSLLLTLVSALFVPVALFKELARDWPAFKERFRRPFRAAVMEGIDVDEHHLKLIFELRENYDSEVLNFASRRLALKVNQVREAYRMVIGNTPFFLILFGTLQAFFISPALQSAIRDHWQTVSGVTLFYVAVWWRSKADEEAYGHIEKIAQVLEIAALPPVQLESPS